MPLKLEIKRKFLSRTDRVKSIDIHPTEPWILTSLYNGNVFIWNYKTEQAVKTFEVTELPVRCSKFIARKQWVITAADDMYIRVYNYNTLEKIKTFEGHTDYIRSLAVHPTQSFVLSSSDDMLIKLWDWEKGWQNVQVFEGHSHYVMMVAFNPKDANTFASASLDRTIKVWGMGSPTPYFTLEGHERGVNCIDYFTGGDKPYLVSGADDRTVRVWDYQNKTCVQTLEGHAHNVSAACYHPTLPIIISGSEDSTLRIWNSNTYRLEKTLNYGMDRVWAVAYQRGSNKLAIGYDEGTVLIKLGSEEPAVSMDRSGKIVWARQTEIQQVNTKAVAGELVDGERLTLPTKELGTCEVFPQSLKHNSNGRFVVVCGDGEYIIYTALAWRNKSFGQALEFVWASDSGEYAVRESTSKIKIFKNFKEKKVFRPNYTAEGIFGGALLGVRSSTAVYFYDWEELRLVRKIEVNPKDVYWSDTGETVTISCESSFYILRYNSEPVLAAFDNPAEHGYDEEEGVEAAFDVAQEFGERVRTGYWIGDCFVYTNANNRLNYCVGSEVVTISHLDRTMYLLGYTAKQGLLYLVDKSLNLVSYKLEESIISYQTAILRNDLAAANKIMPRIPREHRNRIAQFLEAQGYKEQAMKVAVDPDLKFDLAVQLGRLQAAYDIAKESDSEQKWKQLSDMALQTCKLDLAEECLYAAQDLSGLLLLYTSTGNMEGMAKLATLARELGQNNIAFVCYFTMRRVLDCIDLLATTGRIPEAAFFARTYAPSQVSRLVELWREDLTSVNQKAANSLADPAEYPNLFPNFEEALQAEKCLQAEAAKPRPASQFAKFASEIQRDVLAELQSGQLVGATDANVPASPPPTATPTQAPATPPPTQQEEATPPTPTTPTPEEVPAATEPATPTEPASPATPTTPTPTTTTAAEEEPTAQSIEDELDLLGDDLGGGDDTTADGDDDELLNKSIDELLEEDA